MALVTERSQTVLVSCLRALKVRGKSDSLKNGMIEARASDLAGPETWKMTKRTGWPRSAAFNADAALSSVEGDRHWRNWHCD
ncbi:hypothetical protein [Burkholderia metallica]|uniref:hypothetical protein n=1 Tax=Burkholderia metallica TaxID=488729 RepID=UPI00157B4BD0|nr:hypothetical protein [Burkholderia metallica]